MVKGHDKDFIKQDGKRPLLAVDLAELLMFAISGSLRN